MGPLRTSFENDEYRDALASVRIAKNCLWWLILLSIIVQVASFSAVRFVGVVDEASSQGRTDQTTSAPATAASEDAAASAEVWRQCLNWIFPATKFVALVAGVLLVLTMLLAVNLTLVGRTGGSAGFTGGLFWAMLLCVFLIPWQQIGEFRSTFACGALYNFGDLTEWTRRVVWKAKDVSFLTRIFYYARFLAYPCFAAMLLLVVQARFARGWRRANLDVQQSPPQNQTNQSGVM